MAGRHDGRADELRRRVSGELLQLIEYTEKEAQKGHLPGLELYEQVRASFTPQLYCRFHFDDIFYVRTLTIIVKSQQERDRVPSKLESLETPS